MTWTLLLGSIACPYRALSEHLPLQGVVFKVCFPCVTMPSASRLLPTDVWPEDCQRGWLVGSVDRMLMNSHGDGIRSWGLGEVIRS